MKHYISSVFGIAMMTLSMSSCADGSNEPDFSYISDGKVAMEFTFSHPSQSRVTDTSFEQGDVVGLYVSEAERPMEISGNTVNNEGLTYSGSAWQPSHPLYWDAGRYDVLAYYPRLGEIESMTDQPFEVKTDQRLDVASPGMGGYEASDFLYAFAHDVAASANPVNLQFRHIMSKLSIRLIKGEDFEGELPATATVYIHNTVTSATVDLNVGVVTKSLRGSRNTITARQDGPTTYSAILVPQRIESRMPLIEVIMNGVSFLYESRFVFRPGIHHIVSLIVNKNPEQIKIEIGGEITDWN